MTNLVTIVSDGEMSNERRAEECLSMLADGYLLMPEDLGRPDYRAAAQTFALLAIADALRGTTTDERDAAGLLSVAEMLGRGALPDTDLRVPGGRSA